MHAAICDFIVDCLQNSVEAESNYIKFSYKKNGDNIEATIEDNGKGMSQEQLLKARDPFYTDGTKHVKRKVGLGIPFLVQAVSLSGGEFDIQSEKGKGTTLRFTFDNSNIDTPPEGDIISAVLQAMMFEGDYELEFERTLGQDSVTGSSYTVKRSELLDILGNLSTAGTITMAREFLRSQEENLN